MIPARALRVAPICLGESTEGSVMDDTDKLVAAILAAGKASAEGRMTREDYIREFEGFIAAMEKRRRETGNTWAQGVAAAARKEAER